MKISILGCGWLGLELGKNLVNLRHDVKGSVTKHEKLNELQAAGIVPYSIKTFESGIQGDIRNFLSGSQFLIIDIPPGLRKNPDLDFVQKVKNLVPHIERANIIRVLFVSSTSVYADTADFRTYSEKDNTNENDNPASQLAEAEKVFLDHPKIDASILRFGGLYGPERHPVNFLSGRENLKNADAPVNLVHRDDCIQAILKLINLQKDNQVWNLVTPEYPSKKNYYTKIAKLRNLEPPNFAENSDSLGKKISSEKIQKELKFQFKKGVWNA
ncbi:NAD(P)H-binding protein [Gramella sp. AN32]|uniref:NAD(P)H-binding protein n=1 Tax=Christiangramia antarctica TaxID=2058158 RepID=A0ABW5X3E2_9FLAO|nr:NAD(P)H-binding protein [Gramella sp. AN32]MCM4155174.1 NAD(P)-dependent oxidoreductase [Gramella sp. AN32]